MMQCVTVEVSFFLSNEDKDNKNLKTGSLLDFLLFVGKTIILVTIFFVVYYLIIALYFMLGR